MVADHAAISRETMNCLDDGYVHVDLDMVLNVVVTPGIKVHRHGCRPLMNGHCRSCAATLPETLGKFSRGMRVAIVVRTASERRVCVTAPRVKTIFFCTAHSVPCPHAGGQGTEC